MTYQPPGRDLNATNAGGIDPSTDPDGFLADLLARYFRPGLVDSLIRQWVPVAIGSALTWANLRWGFLPDKLTDAQILAAGGATIALYYGLARWAERRWPRLGRWLVALSLTKARPTYAEPAAAAQVEAAAARTTPGT